MTTAIEQLYRLLGRFEQGPHGGPALEAYLCPAGAFTLAYGCTKHPDGSSIKEGDTITEGQVMEYTEAAVERVIADVKATVQRPLTQYQLAAVASFVFNLGIGNLQKSTRLLPAIEAGRWEDAAEALTEFVRAWGHYEGKWHRMALLGLRIRRMAEGCLLLGLDWEEACTADNIGMPKRREWQAEGMAPDGSKGRYYDVLLDGATEFTSIETIARMHPLPALQAELRPPNPAASAGQPEITAPSPSPAAPAVKETAKVSPDASVTSKFPPNVNTKPAAVPSGPAVAGPAAPTVAPSAKAQPVPPPKPVVIAPQPINPNALPTNADTAKNLADSTRMIGMVLVAIGSVIQVVTLRLGIGTAIGAVFFDLSRDPVVITLTVTAIVAAFGWATKRRGKKTFAKGADKAIGNLY